jgi:hypothetical protein
VSWDQRFYDPIELPGRQPLITLRDAALYITKLPKAEHDTEDWQAAMEALIGGARARRYRRSSSSDVGSHRAQDRVAA